MSLSTCSVMIYPNDIPPKRAVDHVIDTGNLRPPNRNAYQLSVAQLEEQTRQVRSCYNIVLYEKVHRHGEHQYFL